MPDRIDYLGVNVCAHCYREEGHDDDCPVAVPLATPEPAPASAPTKQATDTRTTAQAKPRKPRPAPIPRRKQAALAGQVLDARAALDRAHTAYGEAMRRYVDEGAGTYADLARLLRISRQAVRQYIEKERAK